MGALRESDILQRHEQSLREAQSHCKWLTTQQDPELISPRGWRYMALYAAVEELEGSARQLAAFRADARWLRLGVLYAKLLPQVQIAYIAQKWAVFGQIAPLFENGLRHLDELATRRTGTPNAILPQNPTSWLVFPDWRSPLPYRKIPTFH